MFTRQEANINVAAMKLTKKIVDEYTIVNKKNFWNFVIIFSVMKKIVKLLMRKKYMDSCYINVIVRKKAKVISGQLDIVLEFLIMMKS